MGKGGVIVRPKTATEVARSLAERLLDKHQKMGIPEVPNPNFKEFPTVPDDITGLHEKDLSALYGRLDAFAGFVGFYFAKAEVEYLEAAVGLKELEAELALDALSDAKKGEATQRKLEAYLEDRAREMRQKELYHKAEMKILKGRLENIERSIKTLSREQSRREKINDGRQRNN
jgi:polyhydroxyalkanoate synthesis regulator phasin